MIKLSYISTMFMLSFFTLELQASGVHSNEMKKFSKHPIRSNECYYHSIYNDIVCTKNNRCKIQNTNTLIDCDPRYFNTSY